MPWPEIHSAHITAALATLSAKLRLPARLNQYPLPELSASKILSPRSHDPPPPRQTSHPHLAFRPYSHLLSHAPTSIPSPIPNYPRALPTPILLRLSPLQLQPSVPLFLQPFLDYQHQHQPSFPSLPLPFPFRSLRTATTLAPPLPHNLLQSPPPTQPKQSQQQQYMDRHTLPPKLQHPPSRLHKTPQILQRRIHATASG